MTGESRGEPPAAARANKAVMDLCVLQCVISSNGLS